MAKIFRKFGVLFGIVLTAFAGVFVWYGSASQAQIDGVLRLEGLGAPVERIAQLLEAKPKHSVESFAAIQKDDVSLAALELLPIVRNAVPRSERARAALSALAAWNGAMEIGRPEPLIFNAWMREMSRKIFADERTRRVRNTGHLAKWTC